MRIGRGEKGARMGVPVLEVAGSCSRLRLSSYSYTRHEPDSERSEKTRASSAGCPDAS